MVIGEFEEAHSSLQTWPLNIEASPKTKKPKRACMESFLHFATLVGRNLRSFGGIDS